MLSPFCVGKLFIGNVADEEMHSDDSEFTNACTEALRQQEAATPQPQQPQQQPPQQPPQQPIRIRGLQALPPVHRYHPRADPSVENTKKQSQQMSLLNWTEGHMEGTVLFTDRKYDGPYHRDHCMKELLASEESDISRLTCTVDGNEVTGWDAAVAMDNIVENAQEPDLKGLHHFAPLLHHFDTTFTPLLHHSCTPKLQYSRRKCSF